MLLSAALLTRQVLIRPAVGIANNGDFPKMAGPLALGPETQTWGYHRFYGFIYTYVRANRNRYNPGFWSSEFLLVKLARGIQRILRPGPRFDIRWLGAVHTAFLLLGIAFWVFALPGRWRLWLGLLVVLIWTDVAYVQYMNSFYMDAAALIFLVLFAAAALNAVRRPNNRLFVVVAVCAVLLFAATKSQHAIPALAFIPLFFAFAWWAADRVVRVAWVAGAILLFLTAAVLIHRTTDDYKMEAVFNLTFLRLAPEAPDPLLALQELGLGRNELVYLAHSVFAPDVPAGDAEWVRQFSRRCDYGSVLRFYLHHPAVPLRFLYGGLSEEAPNMRPFGNRSPEDGFPRDSKANHFVYWSDFRAKLLARAPWHLILFYLLSCVGAVWLLLGSPPSRSFAALVLAIQAVGVIEYGISTLADAAETFRHLFLFNVTTEITILFFPLLIWKLYQQWKSHARPTAESVMNPDTEPLPEGAEPHP